MRERESTTMQKIAVGLVGTRWNLKRYLVESLEEDPWKFLARVVKEGLAGEGLFRCSECGTWTHDLLPGDDACPGCIAELEEELASMEKITAIMTDDFFGNDWLEIPVRDAAPTGRLDAVVAEIGREADPDTAARDWSGDPRGFADWATDKLIAAMEAEIAGEREEIDAMEEILAKEKRTTKLEVAK